MNILKKLILGTFLSSMMTLANAGMMLGTDLVVAEDGDVMVTYLSFSANYSNTLYLFTDDGIANNDIEIFNNKMTSPGTTLNLGNFTAGTELLFYIFVHDTQQTYYSGSNTGLNADGIVHTKVDSDYGENMVYVGFEDIYNGGDFDYNDLEFSIQFINGTSGPQSVPEPSTLLIFLFALALFTVAKRQRQKQ